MLARTGTDDCLQSGENDDEWMLVINENDEVGDTGIYIIN